MGGIKRVNAKSFILKVAGERYRDFALALVCWEECVGELMASHSNVEKYEDGILYISVVDNVWLQEFSLLKSQIIERLHIRGGMAIREIVFYSKNQKEYKWLRTKKRL